MNDQAKTNAELLEENSFLNQRIQELEQPESERKRASEALRESEERYRMILENIEDGYFEVDIAGNLTFFNDSVCRMVGYPRAEMMGMNNRQYTDKENSQILYQAFSKVFSTGEPSKGVDHEIIRKDGTKLYVESSISLIRNTSGQPTGFRGIMRNDTERKQAEDAKRNAEARYRTLFEQSPNGILLIDPETGKTIEANETAYKQMGYTCEEFAALRISDYETLEKPEETAKHIQKVIHDGIDDFETLHRTKSGEIRNVHVWAKKVQLSNRSFIYTLFQDITERKRAEEALRESQRQQKAILDNIPDIAWLKDRENRFIAVNEPFGKSCGFKPEDLVGKTDFDIWPRDLAERYRADDKEVMESGKRKQVEEPLTDSEGKSLWIETIKTPIYDERGNFTGTAGIARYITERKLAEEALRESEVHYRTLADSGQALIWTSGPDKKCDYFNQPWLDFTGRTREQEMGGGWAEGVHPEDLARCVETYTDAFDRRERFRMIYRLRRHDGEYRWIQDDGSPRCDSKGIFLGFIGHCLDVTEQVRAHESLRESEERFRLLVQSAPEAIYVQTEGRFAYLNPTALRLFGADSSDQLLGHPVIDRFHPDFHDIVKGRIRCLNDEQQDAPLIEERCLKCDGTPFDAEVYAVPITHEGNKGALVFFHDITARKLAADALERTTEQLRKALGATVQCIAAVVETRDPYTAGHQKKVADLARAIAQEMGLTGDLVDGLRMAAVIHDIGKISVPAEILSKPTKLTDIESSLIKIHPQSGYDILKDVEFPWPLAEIVLQHHERMDGSGYPQGLKGDEILIEARILAVADVVEAMASHRPYRPGLGIDAALNEIEKNSGTIYDKTVADACLRLFREKGFKLEGT